MRIQWVRHLVPPLGTGTFVRYFSLSFDTGLDRSYMLEFKLNGCKENTLQESHPIFLKDGGQM